MIKRKIPPSDLIGDSLERLEQLAELDVAFVPERPSKAMTRAGARVGGVDEELAARIYRAMIAAERLDDLDPPEDGSSH